MLQSHPTLAVFGSMVLALGMTACKTRDPNAAGVLDSRPQPYNPNIGGEEVRASEWKVICTPAFTDGEEDLGVKFMITVAGGISQSDESQPILVSVSKSLSKQGPVVPITTGESGRGAVSPYGSIFLGFPGGVLTASYGSASLSSSTHGGVMSLSGDADAMAMPVDCLVER